MPVTASDFLWEATGFSPSGSSVVVTHPDAGGTTAGTTVVVAIAAASITVTPPAGFVKVSPVSTTQYVAAKSDVAAAETTWTFTLSTAGAAAWYMVELEHVALTDPGDGSVQTTGTTANGATRSTGNATNAGSSGMALAIFGAVKVGTTDVQSWSGYTNSFVERVDVAPASGTAGRQIAVAFKEYSGWATWETTATFATTAASASTTATMVLLRSADATINAPLDFFTGFGFGTHAGMATTATADSSLGTVSGVGAQAPTGTWGTAYSVGLNGRNSNYALDVIASASIATVPLPTLSAATLAFGANVQAVSGSGTPVAVHFALAGGSAGSLQVLYDVTNTKFGLTWGGGSTVWQTGTTAVGAYAWIDVRFRSNSSVAHADWFIETGDGDGTQTSPTDLTGRTVITSFSTQLGSTVSQTSRFRYSDVVLSRYAGAYPLGPHVARTLVPSGTGATVSGTSANFQRFTANGTLAAVNGTEGALLDEVPPTISASSDGVVQVTTAASDYLNLPMDTYTLASDEIIAGVRLEASLWSGTGAGAGDLFIRGHDGVSETALASVSQITPGSSTTASATYPLWRAVMWNPGAKWTQTKLDAAALRLGFSTDATPDMGASAMYLEVAIRPTPVIRQITQGEADEFTVDIRVDPDNSASVSYLLGSTHATRGATFSYSISGTPQTPVYVAASATQEVVVNAAAFGDISIESFEPDPLP